jgi:hypothetical protein
MKRSPIKQNVIRQLKSGDAVPADRPRRYSSDHGYIRLRWKVGPQQYVETYEHRVVDGFVTRAEHVHHKNRIRHDNRPENLEHLTADEHREEHRAESLERARRMAVRYEAGRSIIQIAKEFGVDNSVVCRRLNDLGVKMRTTSDYAKPIDEAAVLAEYEKGRGFKAIGRELHVSLARVRSIVEASGLPLRGPGRVRGVASGSGKVVERRKVVARSGGDCEIRTPWCQGRGREFSHRRAEGQGGKWLATNGLFSCGHGNLDGCHGYLHQHPEEATEKGWIVSAWGVDQAEIEVFMWHDDRRDWWLLLPDGTAELAPFPKGRPGHPDNLDLPGESRDLDGVA